VTLPLPGTVRVDGRAVRSAITNLTGSHVITVDR
jgi:hypothetical protein